MTQKNNEANLLIIQKLTEEAEALKVDAAKGGGISELLRSYSKAKAQSDTSAPT